MFDALGMVVFTAVMGKLHEPDGKTKGDVLPSIQSTNISDTEINEFFSNPVAKAPELLDTSSTRIVRDINSFRHARDPLRPIFTAVISRETHVSELQIGQTSRIQITFSYSDGFGREIQKKILSEPKDGSAETRWIGMAGQYITTKANRLENMSHFSLI